MINRACTPTEVIYQVQKQERVFVFAEMMKYFIIVITFDTIHCERFLNANTTIHGKPQ